MAKTPRTKRPAPLSGPQFRVLTILMNARAGQPSGDVVFEPWLRQEHRVKRTTLYGLEARGLIQTVCGGKWLEITAAGIVEWEAEQRKPRRVTQ